MIEDILNETVTLVSHDISSGTTTQESRRLVDVERERLGADADELSDEDIAQAILVRRQAEQQAAQAEADRQALITYARQTLHDFDAGAFSRQLDDVPDAATKEALYALLGAVAALIRLGGYA